jgi:group II intron reverse transcriptase/maturase
MTVPQMTGSMSPGLLKVVERARKQPEGQFRSLAHYLDVGCLRRAFERLKGKAAPGVDGVSKEQYGKALEQKLQRLHRKLKAQQYRHRPIRRGYVPKDDGGKRPIGISIIEDKVVQGALCEVLGAIYEQDFLTCSYGFRPKRSAHDAIRALDGAIYGGIARYILEADIQSFFDSIDRKKLLELLRIRVTDRSFLRLVSKCLHAGVLEGADFYRAEEGTPQGSVISPMLGNVYLHYVLDQWFEREIKPRLRGKALLVRYADDFVIGFEREDDARRVLAVLGKRLARFGLKLHPGKTRLLPFGPPPREQKGGKGPATFDFLGFTLYWVRSRRGRWVPRCKTRRARLRRAMQRVSHWCRRQRHQPVKVQHASLKRRLTGHYNYFGVNGNLRSLRLLQRHAERVWFKWLNRRSQRASLNWERFKDLMRDFPIPTPRITVNLWG